MTERKLDEFAKMLDALKAYPAKKSKYVKLKKIFLNMQKIFMAVGKKLFMGLKMKYYQFLKKMT